MKDVGHSAPASRLKMAAHAQFNTTSKSGLLVFAGGLVIGGALAAALVYAYTDSSQEGRGRNRKNKQREKRRQADAASAYSVSAPAEPGRLQVV